MKKIVVPTDFSPNADKALNFAVQIAKLAKAEIVLVHACDLLGTTFKDHMTLKIEHNQSIVDKNHEQLSLLKKSIEDTEEISVNIELYNGGVADSILQGIEDLQPDLVVMGTLGEAAASEKLFGSLTAAVIGKASVPVIAVPLMSEWSVPGKIFLAVNNFDVQPELFKIVFELAELFNASIHLGIFTDAGTAGAIDYLNDERGIIAFKEKLNTRYKNSSLEHVHIDGEAFQATMEEYIQENGIDIISMLTHKRTFMQSIFNKSMTKKMSYHTRIPLIVLPG